MRVLSTLIFLTSLMLPLGQAQAQAGCETGPLSTDARLGVSRIVEIDTTSGALFGKISRLESEPTFLRPKEVILTFDDGPAPNITIPILNALEAHCTQATFFPVGKMALAYPDIIRLTRARGHTIGSHTFSHPPSLPRLPVSTAAREIDRGFAAVALAAGGQVSPFFRFPGLNDSNSLMLALQRRGIAALTVDVVSNDSFAPDANTLVEQTIKRIEARGGGIILFHDIKAITAKALPKILDRLKTLGYSVVHLRTKYQLTPPEKERQAMTKRLSTKRLNTSSRAKPPAQSDPAKVAKTNPITTGTTKLTAITGTQSPANSASDSESDAQPFQFIRSPTATKAILKAIGPPVTSIAPDPRKRPTSRPKKKTPASPVAAPKAPVKQSQSTSTPPKSKPKPQVQTAKKKTQKQPPPDNDWAFGLQLPGG